MFTLDELIAATDVDFLRWSISSRSGLLLPTKQRDGVLHVIVGPHGITDEMKGELLFVHRFRDVHVDGVVDDENLIRRAIARCLPCILSADELPDRVVLKAVGYWCGEDADHLPDPRKLVGSGVSSDARESIVSYLQSGRPYMSYAGFSYCRFRCGVDDGDMGSRDLTDGEWMWPEGLWHYVHAHDVRLPKEFIETMKGNSWRVPLDRLPDFEVMGTGSSRFSDNDKYWLAWAASQG
jgi:hypothetical protein